MIFLDENDGLCNMCTRIRKHTEVKNRGWRSAFEV